MYGVCQSLVKSTNSRKAQILEHMQPTENLIEIWKKEATTLDFDFEYLDSRT